MKKRRRKISTKVQETKSLNRRVLAKYDSAQTTDENRRHWAQADHLSPNAAISPAIRKTLRARARYEVANNSYAKGIVQTLANYIVGTGPRLQMLTSDENLNKEIEKAFVEWTQAIKLPQKIKTMKLAEIESGEVFALLETNSTMQTPAQLDIRLIEAEQVSNPWPAPIPSPNVVDGIKSDDQGNPLSYVVLQNHPGDLLRPFSMKFDVIPAEFIIHLFKVDRPGQRRGIPEITPALPLFAQLRRYTLAVLSAAEAAAMASGVIYTDAPPDSDIAEVEPMDTVEMERNTWLTMPQGWKVGQFKAEHPTTTYPEFKNEILNEIARCINVPFNLAAGNSSGYNYASGRLDHQSFARTVSIEQSRLESIILNPLLKAWLWEMTRLTGVLPQSGRMLTQDFKHQWFWDGFEHVDPLKEAAAQEKRLANATTTLAAEYARQGKDWQAELEQRAKELKLMTKLGLVTIGVDSDIDENLQDDDDDGNRRKV